jgi:malonate-semialdehyde dehydrogenase (acetylating)/methylmalonate-semialdehyde dehydrogenase
LPHFRVFVFYSTRTVKDRVQTLFRFHNLLYTHIDELADLIVLEHGKNKAEVYKFISFLDHNYFN